MRAAAAGASWVPAEKLHLTLKFLGEQPDRAGAALRDALAPVLARAAAMDMGIGGLGAFPNLRAPRVVWLGVAPDPRLELVHHDIEVVCADLGYEPEGRAFRPHITLGRVREPLAAPAARALADAARGVKYASRARAASVEIMESRLASAGAEYHVLTSLPMSGGR
jgi:2'-5' RNA ligase